MNPASQDGLGVRHWSRRDSLTRVRDSQVDIIVVGGGVTGAGVVWAATLRGYSTALIEAGDFASGTSSRSSKLLHGGLRYLEQLRFRDVHKALAERDVLRRVAAPLLSPVPMVLWHDGERGPAASPAVMRRVLALYDQWGRMPSELRSRPLDRPPDDSVTPGGAHRGLLYHEYQLDDAALVLSVLKEAAMRGALTVNYVKALGLCAQGVICEDVIGRETFELRSKAVVWAIGAWTPPGQKAFVRPSVGVHLVYDHNTFPLTAGFSTRDKGGLRYFAIPWEGVTIVGTSDRDYAGPPGSWAK